MARPREHDGVVYRRLKRKIFWVRYFDRTGKRIRESTFTEDWQEANKKLRERLGARDSKTKPSAREFESTTSWKWFRISRA